MRKIPFEEVPDTRDGTEDFSGYEPHREVIEGIVLRLVDEMAPMTKRSMEAMVHQNILEENPMRSVWVSCSFIYQVIDELMTEKPSEASGTSRGTGPLETP